LGLAPGRRIRRIGLTGGIGSGKSTVARHLVALGGHLVDTDAIARSLTLAGGAALPELQRAFGADVIGTDGALNRDRMRSLVFGDPAIKRQLEAVLHPLIGQEARRQAEAAGEAVIVYDVPLLVESSHWRQRVDRVLVVDCPESLQVSRVMQRSGWTEAAVQAVIAQQAPRAKRRAAADAVIHNEALTLEQLAQQVAELWVAWVGN
jgi:dephospho-CoA kinase